MAQVCCPVRDDSVSQESASRSLPFRMCVCGLLYCNCRSWHWCLLRFPEQGGLPTWTLLPFLALRLQLDVLVHNDQEYVRYGLSSLH